MDSHYPVSYTHLDVYKRQFTAAAEVSESSMRHAAIETILENDGSNDVVAAFDGTWQKWDHTSVKRVVTVISFDTGKVLDFECFVVVAYIKRTYTTIK